MKRFLLFLTCVLTLFGVGRAAEVVVHECLFGSSYYDKNVSSYTSSFITTNDNFSWTVKNGNNNTSTVPWNYVKFGRDGNASVGEITTNSPMPEAISKIVITVDALTVSKINSIKLLTSTDGKSYSQKGTFTAAKGDQSLTLTNPTANLYYQIQFDCASGSSNGLIQVSKVQYLADENKPNGTAPTKVTFSPPSGTTINTSTKISISVDGDPSPTIRYGIDQIEANNTYTEPFTLNEGSHTVGVIAFNDAGMCSGEAIYTVSDNTQGDVTSKVTFDFVNNNYDLTRTTDGNSKETSLRTVGTVDPVSISVTNGGTTNGVKLWGSKGSGDLRMYKGSELGVTCTDGVVKNVIVDISKGSVKITYKDDCAFISVEETTQINTITVEYDLTPIEAPAIPIVTLNGKQLESGGSKMVVSGTQISFSCADAKTIKVTYDGNAVSESLLTNNTYTITKSGTISIVGTNRGGNSLPFTYTFTIGTPVQGVPAVGTKFQKVYDTDELKEGYYIIGTFKGVGSTNYAMSVNNGNKNINSTTNVTAQSEEKGGKNKDFFITNADDVLIVKLEKNDEGLWGFKTLNFDSNFEETQGYLNLSTTNTDLVVSKDFSPVYFNFPQGSSGNVYILASLASESTNPRRLSLATNNNYYNCPTSGYAHLFKLSTASDYEPTFEELKIVVGVPSKIEVEGDNLPEFKYSVKNGDFTIVEDEITANSVVTSNGFITASWSESDKWFAGSVDIPVIAKYACNLGFIHSSVYGKKGIGVLSQAAHYVGDETTIDYSSSAPDIIPVDPYTGYIDPSQISDEVELNKVYYIYADVPETNDTYAGQAHYAVIIEAPEEAVGSEGKTLFEDFSNNTEGHWDSPLPENRYPDPAVESKHKSYDTDITYTIYEAIAQNNGGFSLLLRKYDSSKNESGYISFELPNNCTSITITPGPHSANSSAGYIYLGDKQNSFNLEKGKDYVIDLPENYPEGTIVKIISNNSTLQISSFTFKTKKIESGQQPNLSFDVSEDGVERYFNIFEDEEQKLPTLTCDIEDLDFHDLIFNIDEIAEDNNNRPNTGNKNYEISANDFNDIWVKVYEPGVYTFRAEYDPAKVTDAKYLKSMAILRLNVFPHLSVLPSDGGKLADDERTAVPGLTLVHPDEDATSEGEQKATIKLPSIQELLDKDEFKYSTVSLSSITVKHGDDVNEFNADNAPASVEFVDDGYIEYTLNYGGMNPYSGTTRVNVVLMPQIPSYDEPEDGTTYTVYPSRNATVQYAYVNAASKPKDSSKRKANETESLTWNTAENAGAWTFDAEAVPQGTTEVYVRSYKDISAIVGEDVDGDLVSNEYEVIKLAAEVINIKLEPTTMVLTRGESVEGKDVTLTVTKSVTVGEETTEETIALADIIDYLQFTIDQEPDSGLIILDREGNISVSSETTGKAYLTVSTIEGSAYSAEPAKFLLLVKDEGANDGSADRPYTVAEYLDEYEFIPDAQTVYIIGYVSGFVGGDHAGHSGIDGAADTNFTISDNTGSYEPFATVNIPNTNDQLRSELGLSKSPQNLGRKILVWGTKADFDKLPAVNPNPTAKDPECYIWLDNQPAVALRNETLTIDNFNALFEIPDDVLNYTVTVTQGNSADDKSGDFTTSEASGDKYKYVTPAEVGYYWFEINVPVQEPYTAAFNRKYEVRVVDTNEVDFRVFTLLNNNDELASNLPNVGDIQEVIIGYSTKYNSVAIGDENSNNNLTYRTDPAVVVHQDNSIVPGTAVAIVEIKKEADDKYSLYVKSDNLTPGYLTSAVGVDGNNLTTSETAELATISIEDGQAKVQFASGKYLGYIGGNNSRFSTYKDDNYYVNIYAKATPVTLTWQYKGQNVTADDLSHVYDGSDHEYTLVVNPEGAASYFGIEEAEETFGNTKEPVFGEGNNHPSVSLREAGKYQLRPVTKPEFAGTNFALVTGDNTLDVEIIREVVLNMNDNLGEHAFATIDNIDNLKGIFSFTADESSNEYVELPASEFIITLEPVEVEDDENAWTEPDADKGVVNSYKDHLNVPKSTLFQQYLTLHGIFGSGENYENTYAPDNDYTGDVAENAHLVNIDGYYIPELLKAVKAEYAVNGYDVEVSVPCSGVYMLTVAPKVGSVYRFDEKSAEFMVYPNLTGLFNTDYGFNINGLTFVDKKPEGYEDNKYDGVIAMHPDMIEEIKDPTNVPCYIPGTYFASKFVVEEEAAGGPDSAGSLQNSRRRADAAESTAHPYAANYVAMADLSALQSEDTKEVKVTVEKNGASKAYTFMVVKDPNSNSTTEVDTIGGEDADVEYYDLNGFKVDADRLEKGIYIRIQNGKAEKIMK